jgi:hypothetical protein
MESDLSIKRVRFAGRDSLFASSPFSLKDRKGERAREPLFVMVTFVAKN